MNTNSRTRVVLIVGALAVINALVLYKVFSRQSPQQSGGGESSRQTALKDQIPELSQRLEREVGIIGSETTDESLKSLIDVNLFYWPGPPADVSGGGPVPEDENPLDKRVGQSDLEAIMSNRRFRKILQELKETESAALGARVKIELSREVDRYREMYNAMMQQAAPSYTLEKLQDAPFIAGPTVVIEHPEKDQVTIAGSRLKILSLVWIAGMLKLKDCGTEVERVTQLAIEQRSKLYNDASLHPFFKQEMLKVASLYNRQILASALLGLSGQAFKDVKWERRELTSYKSELTEYDLPVRSGIMTPDYSQGSLRVEFVSPLTDAQFDNLLMKLKLPL